MPPATSAISARRQVRAGRGYFAYTRGSWRIYSLNSERLGDAQLEWLRADLAAHPSRCSMAYWHRPLRSSGTHGDVLPVKQLWRPLYAAGVELVVNGHDHSYERFAPMRPGGISDASGIREFVVGTGGTALRPFKTIKPNSQARQSSIHGVLKLFLADGSYSWRFISVNGSYTDRGSTPCHGRPASSLAPVAWAERVDRSEQIDRRSGGRAYTCRPRRPIGEAVAPTDGNAWLTTTPTTEG